MVQSKNPEKSANLPPDYMFVHSPYVQEIFNNFQKFITLADVYLGEKIQSNISTSARVCTMCQSQMNDFVVESVCDACSSSMEKKKGELYDFKNKAITMKERKAHRKTFRRSNVLGKHFIFRCVIKTHCFYYERF